MILLLHANLPVFPQFTNVFIKKYNLFKKIYAKKYNFIGFLYIFAPKIISVAAEITNGAWRSQNYNNMTNYNSPAKVGNLSEKRKRKRIINPKECQFDMEEALRQIFIAYHEAVKLYNYEINFTNPLDRTRGMEASYFNSKLMQCLRVYFDTNLKRGKYGRMFLYENGYIVLFKKLGKDGKPMNIRTKLMVSIENQLEGNLFNSDEDGSSPIIFFGYSKSKMGELIHPRLVYIDEGSVKWTIEENQIISENEINLLTDVVHSPGHAAVKPELKIKKKIE